MNVTEESGIFKWYNRMECEIIFNKTFSDLDTQKLLISVAFSFVILLSLIINIISVITIIKSSRLKILQLIYMLNINFSSFLNIPSGILVNYTRILGPCWMSDMFACRIYAALTIPPYTACLYSMLGIAYQWHNKVTSRTYAVIPLNEACLNVSLVWLISFIPSLFVLFESLVPIKYNHKLYACVYKSYNGVGFAIFQGLQYLIVTSLTAFYHFKIVKHVRKSRIQVATLQDGKIHQNPNSHKKKDIYLAKKFLIMFIAYHVLLDPSALIVIFELELPQIFYDFSGMMITLILIAMPLMFVFSKKILVCACTNCAPVSRVNQVPFQIA